MDRTSFRWARTSAVGIGLLFIVLIVWDWARSIIAPNLTDYLSYWAAGKLTLAGDPAAAYDPAKHRAVEFTVTTFDKFMPFPYPPPFLLLVTPFSLLPYIWSFAAWVGLTLAIYLFAARRAIDTPYALANPLVLMNGAIGQNGFLTAAIFTTGAAMLRERPLVAGAVLGVLIIKPQLALLLPVAVIAGRLWPAIAGAIAMAGALTFLSLAFLGSEAFGGFWNILHLYVELLRQDKWSWNEFISVFAFLRYLDVDPSVALSLHAIIAAAATVLTWIAWSRDWDEQVPILAAATLLIPPYLLSYDALLMIIPIGFFLRQQPRPRLAGALWLLCLLPIAFHFNLYRGPNTIPIAAILTLAILARARASISKQSVHR